MGGNNSLVLPCFLAAQERTAENQLILWKATIKEENAKKQNKKHLLCYFLRVDKKKESFQKSGLYAENVKYIKIEKKSKNGDEHTLTAVIL